MRIHPSMEWERIVATFPDPNNIPADRQDEFFRAYAQYQHQHNSQHRRAFICLGCYAKLDNHYGVASIVTTVGETKTFGLSGECRARRAAVYNYAKWLRYQRRKAGQMGIDLAQR